MSRGKARRITLQLAWIAALTLALGPAPARADRAAEARAAQDAFLQAHGDLPVVAVELQGLRRTRPAVLEQWIPCRAGDPASRCALGEVVEHLQRLAIFSEVEAHLEPRGGGAAVVVRVEEKWTLYPVPTFWYSPGTVLAGLVVAEANLLGYNKGVAAGGVYSNRGWYVIAGYNDPNLAFTSGWGTLHGFLGHTTVENDAADGALLQSFQMRRLDLEWTLGWTFWDRLSPTWNGAYRRARIGEVTVPGTAALTDETVSTQAFQLIYSDRRLPGIFDEGLRLAAEVQHAFPLVRGSTAYDALIVDGRYASAAPLRGSVELVVRGCWGDFPAVFEERLGGLTGSRTLATSGLVAADRYAWASLGYEVPVLTVSLGTVTAAGFGEVGRYARNDGAWTTYGGPGLGLHGYVKDVAIPAFGVEAGYGLGTGGVQVSVVIGYRPTR